MTDLYKPQDALSNLKRALDEVNATARAIQALDPFRELRETLKMLQAYDPFRDLREMLQQFKEKDPFTELKRTLEIFRNLDPFKDVREHLQKIQAIDPFKNIRGFLEVIQKNQELFRELSQHLPSETVLEESLRSLVVKYVETEPKALDREEILANVISKVEDDAKKAPKTLLSLEFFLNLLITIIVVIYSQKMSNKTEAKLMSELDSLRKTLSNYTTNLDGITHPAMFYVVERTVITRAKPDGKSAKGKVLYPNQKVRLVERKGKWVLIEYYNHLIGVHENGWCLKKYLVICK